MRRSLIVTVTSAVALVLLAMLVPIAILLRDYALEDRLASAALEVQATETVVARQDNEGQVQIYLDGINDGATLTTVLYPDGVAIGPQPGEDERVTEARETGRARVDDVDGGAEILVPVSLNGNSASPAATPVIRVFVRAPGLGSGPTLRAIVVLGLLGAVLLVGALLIADRVGRSFVEPVLRLASYTARLGQDVRPAPVTPSGPAEVRDLTATVNRLVSRIDVLLEREREAVSDLSHRLRTPITALRLRIEGLPDDGPDGHRARLSSDLDRLVLMVDHVVSEARRSGGEAVDLRTAAVPVLAERARFWEPLAEDQARPFLLEVTADDDVEVRAGREDLDALLDVLLDNVFTHTPEGAAVAVRLAPRPGGGLVLTVDDAGPGFPDGVDVTERGPSGADSSGLGLAIAQQTAVATGGALRVGSSPAGGGRVEVELGPPA